MRLLTRLLGLFLLILVLFFGSIFLLPGERIARIAADQISAQTGREVSISGDAKISFWPVLGVATGPIEVANASWSKHGPLLTADSLKVGVDVKSLIAGSIRITGLEAVRPEIIGPSLHGSQGNRFPFHALPCPKVHFSQTRIGLRIQFRPDV